METGWTYHGATGLRDDGQACQRGSYMICWGCERIDGMESQGGESAVHAILAGAGGETFSLSL
ncbi:MAG: hypothetical protein RLZZ224_1517 [Verrucomicrobiota bacterium]